MRVCIHRGSKQIGGSCVEVENCGQRLLIDFGLPLDAEEERVKYLPKIKGLSGDDPTLCGILISHPHLDHFGLLQYLSPKIRVGMGAAAKEIIRTAAPFLPNGKAPLMKGWDFKAKETLKIGCFSVTPYLVDHSAYDSYALKIESNGKSLFYSGDFRAHGRKAVLFDRLIATPPKDIDVLLMEGSSFGRISEEQRFKTEKDIEEDLVELLSRTDGLGLIHTSGQNIDRIVSIFRASKRTGRKLIVDLYVAAVLSATGNENIPQSSWADVVLYVPHLQRIQVKENRWFDLLKAHASNRVFIEKIKNSPEKYTLLFRPLHSIDLERAKCLDGATYIYSQWDGYWEQGRYDSVKKWITKNSIPKHNIHTSGHASLADLKRLAEAIKPKRIVPIHSFMPEKYSDVFQNVHMQDDGEWWEV